MLHKAKPRGLRRKCMAMRERLFNKTLVFPKPHEGDTFWHFHLPVNQEIIDSIHTSRSVRKLCIQTLIDCTRQLQTVKPKSLKYARVVLAISLPELATSQIIVFFDPDYYHNFFDRNNPEQQWTLLPEKRSLVNEWGLKLPGVLREKGFCEQLKDDEEILTSELWFLGEIEE